jgi:hypothetical protein
LVGTVERREDRTPEPENSGVLDAETGLMVQVANARRAHVVGDRLQGFTRQVKKQEVNRPVDD